MRFPRGLKRVFRSVVNPPRIKPVKVKGMFVVEHPSDVTIIVPMGVVEKDFLSDSSGEHRRVLTKMYGEHTLVKLSEVLYRLERL